MLIVDNPGLTASLQAEPRHGLLHSGVSPSGPMDMTAFRLAQALVGNDTEQAAIEFAQIGGSYHVERPALFAVTGGAADIRIDGRPLPAWESHRLAPGQTLAIGALTGAVWGYLAISGGIDVPQVLGSRATHLRNAIGGFEGRTLRAGDRLPLGPATREEPLRLTAPLIRVPGPVHVVPGPQHDYFDDRCWAIFLGEEFSVSRRRDRMAAILDGPLLKAFRGHDIVSDGTPPGSIQVPGSGVPLVLTAERQTTGGYPKIATVASVDLPRLAQMPSGKPFRFARIDRDAAEEALLAERRQIAEALASLRPI